MSCRSITRGALVTALALAWSAPLSATDGHFLHGVGAVNSAMGGAGVASMSDLLGSFYLNPAGIFTEDGSRVALGFEMMQAQRSVGSSFGGFTGETESKKAFVPIPAFGWATRLDDNLTFGVGMLGIGGFGVDYPSDPSNPVLSPRPMGFGQVYSNFQFMKISPALAMRVGEKLYLGASLNLDWASLAVDPMPTASPAVNPATGAAFYSRATAADGAFGIGFQLGLLYQATDMLRVGVSYASPQVFEDFEYNSMYENPALGTFGSPRDITFSMDVPAVYAGGFALDFGGVEWNGDLRYITYSSTSGFDRAGMDMMGAVQGFGWEDIFVLATGVQIQPAERFFLRAGYNFSENPIPDEQSAFNVPAPAIVQHHLTLGAGLAWDNLGIDVGYYRALENEITGAFPTPMGNMDVTNSMLEDAFLVSFSFAPGS
ncbi:MAG: outer membrane protein transport protein [Gemmatimonadales bacterium]|nr:MAG: outer membrane protein transport protein [Gemmatimonadales bacterium]